jgi:hypothetical protein
VSELRVFLEARRKRAKRLCPPGFLFCLKCREPRPPAERMIDYAPLAAGGADANIAAPSSPNGPAPRRPFRRTTRLSPPPRMPARWRDES